MIFHNQPTISKDELKAVKQVLESYWIAQGKQVELFETELSRYLGSKNNQAVAVASGTAALYLVLIGLGIKADDEIIVPTYTCSALLNAIFLARATPILVDINENDLNLDFEKTKNKISKKTKAIIITHTFGQPADLKKFLTLKIPIIEDCAVALGSKYNGRPVGVFGAAAIFSFYASKVITAGYGGMIFSKNKKLIAKIRDYREFDNRKIYYPRFNFQMSDLAAAIGRAQLKKLSKFLAKRQAIAKIYRHSISADLIWPKNLAGRKSNCYRLLLKCPSPRIIKKQFLKFGIRTILPIETYELLHRYLKQKPSNFPISEKIAKTMISLPIYPNLEDKEVKKIINQLNKIL
ncbi:MAG: hypothetical protein A3D39_05380 [Candidatus Buchananbacteria bacterium RIFCSPHIGHO2_02_FULL_39_17]|nr:MAG: hypothetical protein A3D39_05380 [Candidatus Buchananbacteria bacterium RIFCSPHIGHO2_02_FULL_39_17]